MRTLVRLMLGVGIIALLHAFVPFGPNSVDAEWCSPEYSECGASGGGNGGAGGGGGGGGGGHHCGRNYCEYAGSCYSPGACVDQCTQPGPQGHTGKKCYRGGRFGMCAC